MGGLKFRSVILLRLFRVFCTFRGQNNFRRRGTTEHTEDTEKDGRKDGSDESEQENHETHKTKLSGLMSDHDDRHAKGKIKVSQPQTLRRE